MEGIQNFRIKGILRAARFFPAGCSQSRPSLIITYQSYVVQALSEEFISEKNRISPLILDFSLFFQSKSPECPVVLIPKNQTL